MNLFLDWLTDYVEGIAIAFPAYQGGLQSKVVISRLCKFQLKYTMLERIYNSHYGNGVPAMFTS